MLAESFFDRLLGVRHRTAEHVVVIPTNAVHTVGLPEALEIVGLDRSGEVVATRTVPPNRFVRVRGATRVVELPAGSRVPQVGVSVVISDG